MPSRRRAANTNSWGSVSRISDQNTRQPDSIGTREAGGATPTASEALVASASNTEGPPSLVTRHSASTVMMCDHCGAEVDPTKFADAKLRRATSVHSADTAKTRLSGAPSSFFKGQHPSLRTLQDNERGRNTPVSSVDLERLWLWQDGIKSPGTMSLPSTRSSSWKHPDRSVPPTRGDDATKEELQQEALERFFNALPPQLIEQLEHLRDTGRGRERRRAPASSQSGMSRISKDTAEMRRSHTPLTAPHQYSSRSLPTHKSRRFRFSLSFSCSFSKKPSDGKHTSPKNRTAFRFGMTASHTETQPRSRRKPRKLHKSPPATKQSSPVSNGRTNKFRWRSRRSTTGKPQIGTARQHEPASSRNGTRRQRDTTSERDVFSQRHVPSQTGLQSDEVKSRLRTTTPRRPHVSWKPEASTTPQRPGKVFAGTESTGAPLTVENLKTHDGLNDEPTAKARIATLGASTKRSGFTGSGADMVNVPNSGRPSRRRPSKYHPLMTACLPSTRRYESRVERRSRRGPRNLNQVSGCHTSVGPCWNRGVQGYGKYGQVFVD